MHVVKVFKEQGLVENRYIKLLRDLADAEVCFLIAFLSLKDKEGEKYIGIEKLISRVNLY